MKKLFLTSSFDDVADRLPAFIGESVIGKVVTFIPTANVPQDYDGYITSAMEAFASLGIIIDELEVSTASHDEIAEKLEKNDYIYVSGGNTFFLLQALKQSGADQAIIEQVNKGKLYIGESAGSIVTSPDIAYIAAMDSRQKAPLLDTTSGLNLIDRYPVPHYKNDPFVAEAQAIINDYGASLNLQPLSNSQVMTVLGEELRMI